MYKTLILDNNPDGLLGEKRQEFENILLYKRYRVASGFARYWKYISLRIGMAKWYWYEKWRESIKKFEVVIFDDTTFEQEILEYIVKKHKHIRVILYFYNTVCTSGINLCGIDRERVEIWSFDKTDCAKYGLKYNHLYFFPIEINKPIKFDIVFIGKDKGRYKYLMELEAIFQSYSLNTFFSVYQCQSTGAAKDTARFLGYEEVLDYSAETKAILEILQLGQTGYTLRAMEALFLQKKLITNNVWIKNEPFYNKENIFILGEDNIADIEKFINSEYRAIDENIIQSYTYEQWLKNFGI